MFFFFFQFDENMKKKYQEEINEEITQLIKEKREELGMSQTELAKIIQVNKSAISRWESGEVANIGRSKIQALAEALKISPLALLYGKDYKNRVVNGEKPFEKDFERDLNESLGVSKSDKEKLSGKKIPLIGTIAAGQPTLAEENIEEYIDVDELTNSDFCLRVSGDSMINARINNGDIVFIRQQCEVENGEIAAVLIQDSGTYDNNATLKRVYKHENTYTLIAENPKYAPIIVNKENCESFRILGKATYCLAKL